MTQPADRWVEVDSIRLHVRQWLPDLPGTSKPAFLLYHGLSSNAATWDLVAAELVNAGHAVLAVDQRGHGLSDKPDVGYDFGRVAADVWELVQRLGLQQVILVGQSWGGNVVLEVAARYPGFALGHIFVDGGFLNLRQRGKWEQVSVELRPPDLAGTRVIDIKERIAEMHPGWTAAAVNMTLQNFQVLPDGTVRPWLTLERHMMILRAIYEQDVESLFSKVREPVLICAAEDGREWASRKRKQVAIAQAKIRQANVHWFEETAHDIHVDRPQTLAEMMLEFSNGLSASLPGITQFLPGEEQEGLISPPDSF